MTWYEAYYGSWKNGDTVTKLQGTYNRKEIMSKAQETANSVQRVVTVIATKGSPTGLTHKFIHVKPL